MLPIMCETLHNPEAGAILHPQRGTKESVVQYNRTQYCKAPPKFKELLNKSIWTKAKLVYQMDAE